MSEDSQQNKTQKPLTVSSPYLPPLQDVCPHWATAHAQTVKRYR